MHPAGQGLFAERLLISGRKSKDDLVKEMDSVVQMPGWANIWTQPIINRIDMLATGVRTMIGVKVFGNDLDQIQKVSEQVAEVLRQRARGGGRRSPTRAAARATWRSSIDRDRAARYGVNVGDIQDVIEVALGGKAITMTVEGRERFPVRVRYAAASREDEEDVKNLLVSAGGGAMGGERRRRHGRHDAAGRLRQRAAAARADPAGDGRRRADRRRPGHDQERKRHAALLRAIERPRPRRRRLRRGGPAGRGPEGQAAAKACTWPGAAQFENQVRASKTMLVVFPAGDPGDLRHPLPDLQRLRSTPC